MKSNGYVKKLSQVCEKLKSVVPPFKGEKKYFSTKGIQNDGNYQSVNVTYENKPSRAGLYPQINNVGFAKMKGTNKVFIVDKILEDSLFSTGFMILKCKDIVIPKYLFWFFHSEDFLNQKDFLSGDGIMGGLKNSSVAEISIRIPELSEQKEIVEILDQAFESIDKAKANIEKNIDNAKELYKSKLNQIFTPKDNSWEETNLGEIAEFKNGLNFKKSSKSERIKLVGVSNFKNNFYVPIDELAEVNIEGKLREIYELKNGDIITVRSNGNPKLIGRCMLAEGVLEKISHSGFTIRIRLSQSNVNNKLLCYYLKSSKAKSELIESGTGISIKSLNQESLSKLKINYPRSLSEQKEIIETLDILDNHIQSLLLSYKEELENLEELKKSILQKAFSGELTNKNKAA